MWELYRPINKFPKQLKLMQNAERYNAVKRSKWNINCDLKLVFQNSIKSGGILD
jgi:hypothetical protein